MSHRMSYTQSQRYERLRAAGEAGLGYSSGERTMLALERRGLAMWKPLRAGVGVWVALVEDPEQ